jgi:class 3 adenylate cyclase
MMIAVPDPTSATATFLFTDIVGSTQLLRSHRREYASILADHHRLLRETFTAYGGREIDNQGDSFFVAFPRAKDAVLAAAACQKAVAAHSWPGGAAVRVRIGIHTGEADLTVDRYVGLSVHRAARISAVGHGGQVLVSHTTAGLLEDDEEELPRIAFRDLGEHRLKDISRPVRIYQLDIEGLRTAFPPLAIPDAPKPDRRRRAALVAASLVLAGAGALTLALTNREEAPPEVLPNSLGRIDPSTLEPTDVVPIGAAPDRVVVAGGFVWVTHYVLRDTDSASLRNAGDRTLTRIDPSTGDVVVVGGGLAPCGLAADPSGDVWVANCFASGAGPSANVVRIDSKTLDFDETWPVPGGDGFYRGLAYGGGSLWVSEVTGGDRPPERHTVTQVDPATGKQRSIELREPGTPLAWSEGYGDLWVSNFAIGRLTRIHPATGRVKTVDAAAVNPAFLVVDGDVVWVGDWARPRVVRHSAVGSVRPDVISLPVRNPRAGVWNIGAGGGGIWATTPRDGSLWRIDPETNDVTRITMPHLPTGVSASPDGVWVTVRGK